MRLAGLRTRLRRALAGEILGRLLSWLSSSVILLCAGTAAAAILGLGPETQAGLALAAVSALPLALLRPLAPAFLARALRGFDEGSVFESLLDSPPGPARELLRVEAERRSRSLQAEGGGDPRRVRRSHSPRRLPGPARRRAILAAAAALSFAALQLGSLALRGRGLILYRGLEDIRPLSRAEEGRLDAGAEARAEAEEARRAGEKADDEGAGLGEGGAGPEPDGEPGLPASRRPRREEAAARLDAGEEASPGAGLGPEAGEGIPPGESGEVAGERGRGAADGRNREGPAEGYESTGATGVPSPLVDYRSRFFRALAERSGQRVAASGELAGGGIAELQRRYFRSFSLSIEVAPAEGAYEALLRRRWRELRGGGGR